MKIFQSVKDVMLVVGVCVLGLMVGVVISVLHYLRPETFEEDDNIWRKP